MIEWLEPDGRGGFAMGTADGIRTRRYHAVLLAATRPPDGRMVLVADLEVFVDTPAGRFALSSHRYRGDADIDRLRARYRRYERDGCEQHGHCK